MLTLSAIQKCYLIRNYLACVYEQQYIIIIVYFYKNISYVIFGKKMTKGLFILYRILP